MNILTLVKFKQWYAYSKLQMIILPFIVDKIINKDGHMITLDDIKNIDSCMKVEAGLLYINVLILQKTLCWPTNNFHKLNGTFNNEIDENWMQYHIN